MLREMEERKRFDGTGIVSSTKRDKVAAWLSNRCGDSLRLSQFAMERGYASAKFYFSLTELRSIFNPIEPHLLTVICTLFSFLKITILII